MNEPAPDAPGFHEGPLSAAGEQFKLIEQNLLALRAAPGDLEILKAIFRDLRTIKGVRGFPGLDQAQALARAGENVLDGLREGQLRVNARVIELLFQTADLLRVLVEHVGIRMGGQGAPVDPITDGLIARLEALYRGVGPFKSDGRSPADAVPSSLPDPA